MARYSPQPGNPLFDYSDQMGRVRLDKSVHSVLCSSLRSCAGAQLEVLATLEQNDPDGQWCVPRSDFRR